MFALTFSELCQYDSDTQYTILAYIETSPTLYASQSFMSAGNIDFYSYLLRTEYDFNYAIEEVPAYSLVVMRKGTKK